jgi:hypothetical protein
MAARSLVLRTLYEALRISGSERMLARRLHVPLGELRRWLAAEDVPPTPVFLLAVDIICEGPRYTGPERRRRRRDEDGQSDELVL